MDRAWEFLGTDRRAIPQFVFQDYVAPSLTWDHDHCEGCTDKFMQDGVHGTLGAGWASIETEQHASSRTLAVQIADGSILVGQPLGAPRWLCDDCHRIIEGIQSGKLRLDLADE